MLPIKILRNKLMIQIHTSTLLHYVYRFSRLSCLGFYTRSDVKRGLICSHFHHRNNCTSAASLLILIFHDHMSSQQHPFSLTVIIPEPSTVGHSLSIALPTTTTTTAGLYFRCLSLLYHLANDTATNCFSFRGNWHAI